MNIVYIGIGSNIGDKRRKCLLALSKIKMLEGTEIMKSSSLYITEPVGIDSGWFVNMVSMVSTSMDIMGFLSKLQEIEKDMGRKRNSRWSPRTIDLDILFFNNEVINNPTLTLPHPLIHLRRFVLLPLSEIVPKLLHPVLKRSILEILENLKDRKKVIRLPDRYVNN